MPEGGKMGKKYLKVLIENDGLEHWIRLPIKRVDIAKEPYKLSKKDVVIKEIQIELFDYDVIPLDSSINELNYLAEKLSGLNNSEIEKLKNIVEFKDDIDSIHDLINLIDNLEEFELIKGVRNYHDLGEYYSDNYEYESFEQLGEDIANNDNGFFTDKGYISCPNDTYYEEYDGTVPKEFCLV